MSWIVIRSRAIGMGPVGTVALFLAFLTQDTIEIFYGE